MGKLTITMDDLVLALLESQGAVGGDGFTSQDLMEQTGLGRDTVLKRLKVLKATGRLETTKIQRGILDGRLMTVTGYRLKANND